MFAKINDLKVLGNGNQTIVHIVDIGSVDIINQVLTNLWTNRFINKCFELVFIFTITFFFLLFIDS